MLLVSKSSFEECRGIWETSENRISLTRWKKKNGIEFCRHPNCHLVRSVEFPFFLCLTATNFGKSTNPIAREFYPVWKCEQITIFTPFIAWQTSIGCCEQTDFKLFAHSSFATILKESENENGSEFKTYFANAVGIWHFPVFPIGSKSLSPNPSRKEKRRRKARETIGFCENS